MCWPSNPSSFSFCFYSFLSPSLSPCGFSGSGFDRILKASAVGILMRGQWWEAGPIERSEREFIIDGFLISLYHGIRLFQVIGETPVLKDGAPKGQILRKPG
jgi:hypothetical protein